MMFKQFTNAVKLAAKGKKIRLDLELKTLALAQKDIKSWRQAWQAAINIENPKRMQLYSIYQDALIDNHLSGAIEQRKDFVLQKAFKLVDAKGKENLELTQALETGWFKDFLRMSLDSIFWGHSLVEFGDIIDIGGRKTFSYVQLVPRHHVCPEYGVLLRDSGDDVKNGISYREDKSINQWVVEAGTPNSLGLLLQVCPQVISKRYAMAYWDQWGEAFGAPVRIAKTNTRDEVERSSIFKMLENLGFKSFGVFPEGTEIEFKETNRSDAYLVYDKRIERANNEMSKAILGQTMTLDNGSSKSQGEVHLQVLQNIINQDADFLKDIINDRLLPFLEMHGFSFKGYTFAWDETIDLTPEQQKSIEEMLINNYEVDPQYFIDKYNIPVKAKAKETALKGFFD